jgi:hypothetical protein
MNVTYEIDSFSKDRWCWGDLFAYNVRIKECKHKPGHPHHKPPYKPPFKPDCPEPHDHEGSGCGKNCSCRTDTKKDIAKIKKDTKKDIA